MVRLTISAFIVLCTALISLPATATDFAAAAAAASPVQSSSTSAARLYALGITTRAQGATQSAGQTGFTPPMSPTAATPAVAPVTCGNGAPGQLGSAAAVASVVNGMRFMPLHRDTAARTFAMPQRREIVPSAEALRTAVAGSKNTSDLAQVALQAANAPSPQSQAQAELASLTGNPSTATPTNPTALANEQVLAQIQHYRNSHTSW